MFFLQSLPSFRQSITAEVWQFLKEKNERVTYFRHLLVSSVVDVIQVNILEAGLVVHKASAPENLMPFHLKMEGCFAQMQEKVFKGEESKLQRGASLNSPLPTRRSVTQSSNGYDISVCVCVRERERGRGGCVCAHLRACVYALCVLFFSEHLVLGVVAATVGIMVCLA